MDNLPELRDIHLPTEGISIFPLAPGWWIMIGSIILLILLFGAAAKIWRGSVRLYVKHMLKPLHNELSPETAVKLSEILRRICRRKYPQAVSLSGREWIDFLNAKSKYPIDEKAAEILQYAPFMQKNNLQYNEADILKLWQYCADWAGDNL